MAQFPPGLPYVAGQQTAGGIGGLQRQQSLIRAVSQAKAHTRYDGVVGQAVIFGPLKGSSSLLFSRVMGPFGAYAYLYIGQGNLTSVVVAENLESTTVSGHDDEASWARPGLPVYDQWSVAIWWNRSLSWGVATAKIYYEAVAAP